MLYFEKSMLKHSAREKSFDLGLEALVIYLQVQHLRPRTWSPWSLFLIEQLEDMLPAGSDISLAKKLMVEVDRCPTELQKKTHFKTFLHIVASSHF